MSRPARLPNIIPALGLLLVFLVTRLLILLSLRLESVAFVANDVSYYGYHLFHLFQGDTQRMLEYPSPAVWILQGIYVIGGGWQHWLPVYAVVFVLLDAAVAASLFRRGHYAGCLFWILFTGANGAIAWFRFDLIPAALVAWACLLLVSRPKLAGGLVGLGAAIKLWPALLIGPLLAPHPWRDLRARGRWIGFVVVGFALALATLAIDGWSRAKSPLEWQSERGLQIESVPATPVMFLRAFTDDSAWQVFMSQYNALEVSGPGVAQLLRVSTVLTVATVALAVFLTLRLIRNLGESDPRTVEALLLAVNTVVLALIVANKTLSPQYILWLGGPTAVLLLHARSSWLPRHARAMAIALVIIGGLTQATYPWLTYGILGLPPSPSATSVLVLRNVGLVILTGYSCWLTLRASRRQDFVGKLPASSRRSLRPRVHDVHTEGIVA